MKVRGAFLLLQYDVSKIHCNREMKSRINSFWVCFISVETVPKVGANDQIFSTKPSGRSFCQLIWNTPNSFATCVLSGAAKNTIMRIARKFPIRFAIFFMVPPRITLKPISKVYFHLILSYFTLWTTTQRWLLWLSQSTILSLWGSVFAATEESICHRRDPSLRSGRHIFVLSSYFEKTIRWLSSFPHNPFHFIGWRNRRLEWWKGSKVCES